MFNTPSFKKHISFLNLNFCLEEKIAYFDFRISVSKFTLDNIKLTLLMIFTQFCQIYAVNEFILITCECTRTTEALFLTSWTQCSTARRASRLCAVLIAESQSPSCAGSAP